MIYYKCPSCKREKYYVYLAMKVCLICMEEMEVIADGEEHD